MVAGWFDSSYAKAYYNEFINALLNDNVRKMNTFMKRSAPLTLETVPLEKHTLSVFIMALCLAWL